MIFYDSSERVTRAQMINEKSFVLFYSARNNLIYKKAKIDRRWANYNDNDNK